MPEFGFSWNESNFDPFKENDISQSLREQAAWFLEQDKLDSKFRKNQIKSILKRMPLKDNQLIAMTFNSKFSLLFLNWAASALKYGIDVHDRCIVFPMDDESAGMAQREGFSICYNRDSEILRSTGEANNYGDSEFARHMFYQNAVIRDLLECGVDLLFQDVDVVWRKDPLPLLLQHPDHVQFMFDGENRRHRPLHANTGFMYFRNEPVTRDFWEIIYNRAEQMFAYGSQQEPLNKVLGLIDRRGFKVRILEEADFANGHLMNIVTERNRLPVDPYVIHCSWTGQLDEKYRKYTQQGIWYLDDAPPI